MTLLGSILLVLASSAVLVNRVDAAGKTRPVIAVTQPVAQGGTINADDLTTVRVVAVPGVSTIPGARFTSVVGRTAGVQLLPGTLLSPAEITSVPDIPEGSAIVGVAVKPGQIPATAVEPGEQVDVVLTGPEGDAVNAPTVTPGETSGSDMGSAGAVMVPAATVVSIDEPSASSGSTTVVVSVLVPRDLAPLVAAASAAGQVALVTVSST